MATAPFSITQLRSLVERISAEVNGLGAELRQYAPNTPVDVTLDLDQLQQLWPQSDGWELSGLSRETIAAATAAVDKRAARAAAKAAEVQVRIKQVGKAWAARHNQGREWQQAALAAVASAGAEATRLHQQAEQARAAEDRLQREIRKINAWLTGVQPRGLRRFIDADGHELGRGELEDRQQRKHEAWQDLRRVRAQAEEAEESAALATGRQERAEADLAQAREFARRLRANRPSHGARLRKAAGDLKARREGLAVLRKLQSRLSALDLDYGRALDLAREMLAELSPEGFEAGEGRAVLDDCAQSQDLAREHGERAIRLAEMIRRQERGLVRRGSASTNLSRKATAINREIRAMETELPELIGPLTNGLSDPDGQSALASLATMRGRLLGLQTRGGAVQNDLSGLVLYLGNSITRSKVLTEAWRDAGRMERASLSQAEALAEQARSLSQTMSQGVRTRVDEAAALMDLVAVLGSGEMAGPLSALVEDISQADQTAEELDSRAVELARQAPDLQTGSLARTPAKLKPHSVTHRRLAQRGVEMERLWAMAEAVEHWHSLAEGPLAEEIKRPLREEAEALSRQSAETERRNQELSARCATAGQQVGHLELSLLRAEKVSEIAETKLAAALQEADQQSQELSRVKSAHEQALALLSDYEAAADHAEKVERQLARYRRLAGAMRNKALERHQLLQGTRRELAGQEDWGQEAIRLSQDLTTARQQLDWAQQDLASAKDQQADLEHSVAQQPELASELATARAQLDGTQQDLAASKEQQAALERAAVGQAGLSAELAASRQETEHWSQMAAKLSASLVILGGAHRAESEDLKAELGGLRKQVTSLDEQLRKLSLVLIMATSGQEGGPGALTPEQTSRILERLSAARQRLSSIGRATLGHWAIVGALTASMVLVDPYPPSKATHRSDWRPPPITASLMVPRGAVQSLTPEFNLDLQAKGRRLSGVVGSASLDISLMPLRAKVATLPHQIRTVVESIAAKASLSADVLIASARAAYSNKSMVEMTAIRRLADVARRLLSQTPVIHSTLMAQAMDNGVPAPDPRVAHQDYRVRFTSRFFREYRSLGFSPDEALGALAADELAVARLSRSWTPPGRCKGKVLPLATLEKMDAEEFVRRMTPYITSRIDIFLRSRRTTFSGDAKQYARGLAFDMYAAAKRFSVPVTFMAAIAHQETWYANVLGDQDLSASPYQIWEPTRFRIIDSMARAHFVPPPKSVRLEQHITMATYMAAFHLRELMQAAYHPAKGRRLAWVDMNRVMKSYNGSSLYAGRVAGRRAELSAFLARPQRPSKAKRSRLQIKPAVPKL